VTGLTGGGTMPNPNVDRSGPPKPKKGKKKKGAK
jgi:hypothetical protein